MSDITTIQIRDDQHEALEQRKEHPAESYKAVIDRLLDEDDTPDDAGDLDDELAAEIIDRLDRLEASAQTAETRTGRIESTLEEMGAGL